MNKIEKATILVVDDTPDNIDLIRGLLSDDYKILAAINGEKAVKIATNPDKKPDLILLDIMMPVMDGYEVIRQLKDNPLTMKIPVIFLTAKSQVEDEKMGFELGAVDYITKPISPPIVKARVKTHLALYDQNRTLEEKVRQRTLELQNTRLEIIRRLGRAAEFKDNETGLHVIRMSHYARIIGEGYGLNEQESILLLNASPMHDVGKIGIPDNILRKPGKLDPDEWNTMRTHCDIGAEIIGDHDSELLKHSAQIALTHHERWDGKGYPNGLKEDDIPLFGRMAAIADVFDALTSRRPYKEPWPVDKAINLLKEESGLHFDPKLVEVFIKYQDEILKVMHNYSEN